MLNVRTPIIDFIWNDFQLDPELYQCPEDVGLQPLAVERPYWGLWFLISGMLILLLYTPCLIAIATHDLIRTASYKAMLVLAVYDLLSTFVHSIATGIFGLMGVTFCDAPCLIFVLGAIGLGSWMACCAFSIILAVIRICDINPTYKLGRAFEERKIYLWLGGSCLYGCLGTFFTQPIIFSPADMSWFFDPDIGKDPNLYVNYVHTFNNITIALCTSIFYSFLCFLVFKKAGGPISNKLTAMQYMTILQAFFFCIFHTIGSVIYVYMQFFTAPSYMILVAQVAWQTSTASIAIVYLTLNKTIRTAVMELVCPKKVWQGNQVTTVLSLYQIRTTAG